MLEDGLYERAYSREEPLTWVNNDTTATIREGGSTRNRDVRIETAASGLYIVEALSQRHFRGVNISTVVEQLDAYTRREFLGQALVSKRTTLDGLSLLTNE